MTTSDIRPARGKFLAAIGFIGVSRLVGILAAALVLYPLATIVVDLFHENGRWTLAPFATAAQIDGLGSIVWNTLVVVVCATGFALAVSTVLAWIAERTDAGLGPISAFMPMLPLFLPPIAATIGWVFLLNNASGIVNVALRGIFGLDSKFGPLDVESLGGMIWVTAMFLVPYGFLTMSAAFRGIDADMEWAARTSGATQLRTFFRVTLPAIIPALISSAVLMVMMSLTLLSVGLIIGTPARIEVVSAVIYRVMAQSAPPQLAVGLVLSLGVVLVILLLLLAQWAVTRGRRFRSMPTRATAPTRLRLGPWKWPIRVVAVGYVVVSAILPLLGLLVVSLQPFWSARINWSSFSLRNYGALFSNGIVVKALTNSAFLAVCAALAVMLVAFLIAWSARSSRAGRVQGIVTGITGLPAGIPHLVFGVGFLIAFSQPPLALYGSLWLVFLAYVVIWLPQAMQSARFGMRSVGQDLIEAGRVGGATESRTFRLIGLPLAMPQLVGGALIVFVLSMSEFNATAMLVSPSNSLTGPTMFALWDAGNYPPVAAFAIIVCVCSAVVAGLALGMGRWVRRDRKTVR